MVHGESTEVKCCFHIHYQSVILLPLSNGRHKWRDKHQVHCHQTWSHIPWLLRRVRLYDFSPSVQTCTGPRQGRGLENLYHCPYFRNDLDTMVCTQRQHLLHVSIHMCICVYIHLHA